MRGHAFFTAVGIFVWNHIHTLRLFRGMEDMLEAAFRGDFSESRYDESRMSALEVRMCQYLKEQEGQRRRLGRELAMLQSIGMTGRQLKKMLICEGCAYSVIAF